MPHKHKRKVKNDGAEYNLPPTTRAKALPVRSNKGDPKITSAQAPTKTKRKKSASAEFQDDTPRAFAVMMKRFQQPTNGRIQKPDTKSDKHDDNSRQNQSRKRKRENEEAKGKKSSSTSAEMSQMPKILPGERMSDFSARVDQALPLSGITKKSNNVNGKNAKDAAILNLRENRQTKHERRLQRLQREWREDDVRIKQKREAVIEEKATAEEENDELWKEWEREAGKTSKGKSKKKNEKKKKQKRKKKGLGAGDDEDGDGIYEAEDDGVEDDPWAKLNNKARNSKPTNPFDVVQAPPEKLAKPREIFKVRGMGGAKVNVADIPASVGSLRRREELADQRQSVVDEYRRIMASKRD